MEIGDWPAKEPGTAKSVDTRPAVFSRSNGYDNWGRPWTYMGCPDELLQVFMKTSNGRGDGRLCRLSRRRRTLPATGNGNTKKKQQLHKSGNLREEKMSLAHH